MPNAEAANARRPASSEGTDKEAGRRGSRASDHEAATGRLRATFAMNDGLLRSRSGPGHLGPGAAQSDRSNTLTALMSIGRPGPGDAVVQSTPRILKATSCQAGWRLRPRRLSGHRVGLKVRGCAVGATAAARRGAAAGGARERMIGRMPPRGVAYFKGPERRPEPVLPERSISRGMGTGTVSRMGICRDGTGRS